MKTDGKYVALRINTSRPIIKGEKVRTKRGGVAFTFACVTERGEIETKESVIIRAADLVDVMVRDAK